MALIQRGDVRWFSFGSPDKRRPVLVLGAFGSTAWSRVPVIPFSTQVRALPWEVAFGLSDGFAAVCVLKPEWIATVDRTRLGPCMTRIPEARWGEIRTALLLSLGFELDA